MSANELQGNYLGDGPTSDKRLPWLDGVRALAALFVVVHHSWLMTVGGYPRNYGPWFTDWMVYGHLAVSVFIVVSGYSLALGPVRTGFSFKDGGYGFLRRRFWRIVPPYWCALLLVTLLIATGLTDPANGKNFSIKDFFVHFFLVQDAFGNVSPNGVFWSIAVEWHIYFIYPAILLVCRRWGTPVAVTGVLLLVMSQHVIGAWIPAVALFNRFTPIYLLLFIAGFAAARLVSRGQAATACAALAGLLLVGFLVYAVSGGTETTTAAYFWVDLTVGSATACAFVAFDQSRLRWAVRCLSFRPLVAIGTFSFSLYLVHAPILAMTTTYVVRPLHLDDMTSLSILFILGVPISIAGAYAFFYAFEKPFLTIRSPKQFCRSVGDLWSRARIPTAARAAFRAAGEKARR